MGSLNYINERRFSPQDIEISRLEDQIRRMQDEIDILKDALLGTEKRNRPWWTDWGLTPTEAITFDALVQHQVAYRETLMAALYYDRHPDRVPGQKVLDVVIYNLRRKLAPRGVKIYTKFHAGWFLDKDVRANLLRNEPVGES